MFHVIPWGDVERSSRHAPNPLRIDGKAPVQSSLCMRRQAAGVLPTDWRKALVKWA